MRTILQPQIIKLICDDCKEDCTGIGFCCVVDFNFGYGTGRDGEYIKFELCNNCAENLLSKMKENYPKFNLKYEFD